MGLFFCCKSIVPTTSRAQGRAFRWIGSSWRRYLLTTSYVEGGTEPPLSTATLPEYFANTILPKYASRPALISRHEKQQVHGGPNSKNMGIRGKLAWDFEELDRHVQALSAGLLDMGVKKGDRVAVIMGNSR